MYRRMNDLKQKKQKTENNTTPKQEYNTKPPNIYRNTMCSGTCRKTQTLLKNKMKLNNKAHPTMFFVVNKINQFQCKHFLGRVRRVHDCIIKLHLDKCLENLDAAIWQPLKHSYIP